MASHADRLAIANEVAAAVLRRWGTDHVLAIGLHGSVARGEDDTGSDIDLAVVTAGPEPVIPDRVRRVRDVIVDLGAISADDYLALAERIGPNWPVASEQYVITVALYDPTGFFERLRETHLRAVASAPAHAFTEAASLTMLHALDSLASLQRHIALEQEPAARTALGRTAEAVALTLGLLERRTASNVERLALSVARDGWAPAALAEPFRAAESMSEAAAALVALGRERGVPWEGESPLALLG
jgi:predicted nucleotidyltransferase